MLNGLTVLDLTTNFPGPYCTLLLSQCGANVIKVENPHGGDPARTSWPGMFDVLNRGKQSVAIDLKSPGGLQMFYELAEYADVLIEGFRPGVMKRLRADYNALAQINPGLIYCSISGYGQEDGLSQLPSHDINFGAMVGLIQLTGETPTVPGTPVSDFAASMFALSNILLALMNRTLTGEGKYIDIPIVDAALSLMTPRIGQALDHEGRVEYEDILGPAYGLFRTADEAYISLGIREDRIWQLLCDALSLSSELKAMGQSARQENRAMIRRTLAETFAKKDRAYWVHRLQALGVACTPVNRLEEVMTGAYFRHRGTLREDRGRLLPDSPIGSTTTDQLGPAPGLGEHTDTVWTTLPDGSP